METLALSLLLLVGALVLACDPSLPRPSSSRGAPVDASATGGASGIASTGSLVLLGASAGGWPSFGGGVASATIASGSGGAGGLEATIDAGIGGSSSIGRTSRSSSASSSSGGGAPSWSETDGGSCDLGHVVIGEVRTRGPGGASDEFVALFNATPAPVTLDATFSLEVRSATATSFRAHWTGKGGVIPAFGHFLIGGSAYTQSPVADDALSVGVTDAAALRLVQGGVTMDTVCFGYDAKTMAFDESFACAGVASNLPHDDESTASSDVDASLARLPGGDLGNCAATGDAAVDFVTEEPATPASTVSLAEEARAGAVGESPGGQGGRGRP